MDLFETQEKIPFDIQKIFWMDKLKSRGVVLNTWNNNEVVFKGSISDCEKYIKGNNVYQMNYSKLKIKKLDN